MSEAGSEGTGREPTVLVGWDIVEVGLRQAWPFVTFCSPGGRTERRLFIDTDFVVRSAGQSEPTGTTPLARLEPLVMLGVTRVEVSADQLKVCLDDGTRLEISNHDNAETTHAPWWFGTSA